MVDNKVAGVSRWKCCKCCRTIPKVCLTVAERWGPWIQEQLSPSSSGGEWLSEQDHVCSIASRVLKTGLPMSISSRVGEE